MTDPAQSPRPDAAAAAGEGRKRRAEFMVLAWSREEACRRHESLPVPFVSLDAALAFIWRKRAEINHAFVAMHIDEGWYRQRYAVEFKGGRRVVRDLGISNVFYDCGVVDAH